jgi:hypothetical protein
MGFGYRGPRAVEEVGAGDLVRDEVGLFHA